MMMTKKKQKRALDDINKLASIKPKLILTNQQLTAWAMAQPKI